MKTVEYRGNRYMVPSWAKFMATDEDGAVWAYHCWPIDGLNSDDAWDSEDLREPAELIVSECLDWRDSLVELPE